MSQPSVQLKFLIKYKQINLCVDAVAVVVAVAAIVAVVVVGKILLLILPIPTHPLSRLNPIARVPPLYLALHIRIARTAGQNESTYYYEPKNSAILFHTQIHK